MANSNGSQSLSAGFIPKLHQYFVGIVMLILWLKPRMFSIITFRMNIGHFMDLLVKVRIDWKEFRAEVKNALLNYYGNNEVVESRSGKCIKVMGKVSRLNADVVPCVTYRKYTNYSHFVSGITFWTKHNVQIVNYPKIHLNNGSDKNSQCGENYKPTVRIFKNARNAVIAISHHTFLNACCTTFQTIVFLVPIAIYSTKCSNSSTKRKLTVTLQKFQCQNKQQYMFGNELHQVNLSSARDLIDELIELWNH